MNLTDVLWERDGGVVTITMNRPDKLARATLSPPSASTRYSASRRLRTENPLASAGLRLVTS